MTYSTPLSIAAAGLILLAGVPSHASGAATPPREPTTTVDDNSTLRDASSEIPSGPTEERDTESNRNLRLEDITIEGDVDIPRVLFIESRGHLRDQDFLHYLFLPSAAQLGREAPVRRILHWSPQGEHQPWTP